jgi:hypothetical protein
MAPTLADLRLPVKIDPALLAAAARVVFYTLLWYTFSIGITFYNKWLFQWCVITSVLHACALACSVWSPALRDPTRMPLWTGASRLLRCNAACAHSQGLAHVKTVCSL